MHRDDKDSGLAEADDTEVVVEDKEADSFGSTREDSDVAEVDSEGDRGAAGAPGGDEDVEDDELPDKR